MICSFFTHLISFRRYADAEGFQQLGFFVQGQAGSFSELAHPGFEFLALCVALLGRVLGIGYALQLHADGHRIWLLPSPGPALVLAGYIVKGNFIYIGSYLAVENIDLLHQSNRIGFAFAIQL